MARMVLRSRSIMAMGKGKRARVEALRQASARLDDTSLELALDAARRGDLTRVEALLAAAGWPRIRRPMAPREGTPWRRPHRQ